MTISSIALALPTSRASRCVPPVPGSTPSATSGRPILPAPARATRRSAAIATSSPPPTQCPFSAAITSFGVCSSRFSVSLAWRQKQYLNAGSASFSMPMFAPAQKNRSPAPMSTITWTDGSMRADEDRLVQLAHHLVRVGVGRRIVQLEDGDAVGDLGVDLRHDQRLGPHVLEIDRQPVDAALRRGDVVGELARLVDRLHLDAVQVGLVLGRRQPLVLAALPLLGGQRLAERVEVLAGVDADLAVEAARRQHDPIRHAVRLEHPLVPAIDAGLAVADVPVAQHLVQRVAHRHLFANDEAAVVHQVEHVHVARQDVVVVELVLLGAALEAVGEVGGGVARHLAAVQVEALAEPEVDELLDQRQVDAAGLAHVTREAGFAQQLAGPFEDAGHAGSRRRTCGAPLRSA